MATVAEIDRVQSLVNRLKAVGGAQRGDLIRAQQWNDLVMMVVEIAQALLDFRPTDNVPPHEHPDQVKLTWLAPSVRTLIERGPLADPAATSRVSDVERQARAASADLDKLRESLNSARERINDIATRDLVRDSDFNEIRLQVGALSQRRDEVGELRKSLDSIATKVDRAVEASTRFVINGEPVDMNQIDARIRLVEELRTRLTTAAGAILDASEFDRRLSTLANTLVTQEQLNEAVRQRPAELPPGALDGIRAELLVQLRQETDVTINALAGQIRTETETRLGEFDARVGQRIEDRVNAGVDAAQTNLRAEITTAVSGAVSEARAFAQQSAASAAESVRATLGTQLDELRSGLGGIIGRELGNLLPNTLGPIEALAAAARTDAAAAVSQLAQTNAAIQAAGGRIEQVAQQIDSAVEGVRTSLLSEISRREQLQKADLDRRFEDVIGRFDPRIHAVLDPRFDAFETAIAATVEERATSAAASAVNAQLVSLRADMQSIARNESLALQDTVAERLRNQLEPVLIERMSSEASRQFRREISTPAFATAVRTLVRNP